MKRKRREKEEINMTVDTIRRKFESEEKASSDREHERRHDYIN